MNVVIKLYRWEDSETISLVTDQRALLPESQDSGSELAKLELLKKGGPCKVNFIVVMEHKILKWHLNVLEKYIMSSSGNY